MSSGTLVRAHGAAEDRNARHRRRMEDAHAAHVPLDETRAPRCAYFGVYDGHAGKGAALFCAAHMHEVLASELESASAQSAYALESDAARELLERSFEKCNAQLAEDSSVPKHCGCTAAVALVSRGADGDDDGSRVVHSANAGDARVLLVKADGSAQRLSVDHKVEDPEETARIEAAGGFIQNGRVGGQINVSRSIGDQLMKKYIVSTPHVACARLSADDVAAGAYVVLCCDGVFDVLADNEVGAALVSAEAHARLADAALEQSAAHAACAELAKVLVKAALAASTEDNLTALVVRL